MSYHPFSVSNSHTEHPVYMVTNCFSHTRCVVAIATGRAKDNIRCCFSSNRSCKAIPVVLTLIWSCWKSGAHEVKLSETRSTRGEAVGNQEHMRWRSVQLWRTCMDQNSIRPLTIFGMCSCRYLRQVVDRKPCVCLVCSTCTHRSTTYTTKYGKRCKNCSS